MYSDRDMIPRGRESQTEDFAGKAKEWANKIIELPCRREPARIDRQQLQREAVQDRMNYVHLSYIPYGFCAVV